MDLNLLYAILIALIPVVLTIIFSRVYNIFHGLFSFLVFSFLICFLYANFSDKFNPELSAHLAIVLGTYSSINAFVLDLLKIAGLSSVFEADYGKYVILGIYVLVFIVSQIFASVIRKKRVEKIRGLRRQIKRY